MDTRALEVTGLPPDVDPGETQEWTESIRDVIDLRGAARARYLLRRQLEVAEQYGAGLPPSVSTPYVNTIPADQQPATPGNLAMERRVRAYLRWNAVVMVLRANAASEGIGGHLSTYASSASLYETGFNHFFRGKDDGGAG
ncbi:MAG: pyruvate dehydrogenase component, partial [Actinomycetota bacterium]|nr:pyruvate dehydrogenase component [Actinomycetota bacterium]